MDSQWRQQWIITPPDLELKWKMALSQNLWEWVKIMWLLQISETPVLIDTYGWPWICVGFEFDIKAAWPGEMTMTVESLDLEWGTGYAKSGDVSTSLKRIGGNWYWDGSISSRAKSEERLENFLLKDTTSDRRTEVLLLKKS